MQVGTGATSALWEGYTQWADHTPVVLEDYAVPGKEHGSLACEACVPTP